MRPPALATRALSQLDKAAAEHGVPQIRERVFMIGSRDGRVFRFPEPRYGDPKKIEDDLFGRVEPYRTACDALGDLPEPNDDADLKVGGKWGDLLPNIPEGENYLWHTDRGGGSPVLCRRLAASR